MNYQVMLIAAVSLCLGACAEPEVDHQRESAAVSAGTQAIDACDLLSPGELGEIFLSRVFTVNNEGPVPRNQPGGPNRSSVTSCTFVSDTVSPQDMLSITVVLSIAPSDARQPTTAAMKSGVTSLGIGATPVDIAGLGDDAYWVNLGSDRRSAVAVNVRHEPRMWLTVSESSAGQEVQLTVERLTGLARRALARL